MLGGEIGLFFERFYTWYDKNIYRDGEY